MTTPRPEGKGYEFVTLKQIEANLESINWKESQELLEKVFNEREAFRQIAEKHLAWRFNRDVELQEKWAGKTTTKEDVVFEARRLLEQGGRK